MKPCFALSLSLAMLPSVGSAQFGNGVPLAPLVDGRRPRPPSNALIPYEEGTPVPPGMRVVTRNRAGLIAAGASIFGTTYFVTSIAGTLIAGSGRRPEGAWLFAPVIGPWVYAASGEGISSAGAFWLAMDGLLQGAGLAMLLGGALNPVRGLTYARSDENAPRWTLTPGFAGGPGASLHVTF